MTIDVLMTAANVRAVVICRYATFMISLPKIYSKFDGLWCVCYLTIQAQGLGRDWVAPRSQQCYPACAFCHGLLKAVLLPARC